MLLTVKNLEILEFNHTTTLENHCLHYLTDHYIAHIKLDDVANNIFLSQVAFTGHGHPPYLVWENHVTTSLSLQRQNWLMNSEDKMTCQSVYHMPQADSVKSSNLIVMMVKGPAGKANYCQDTERQCHWTKTHPEKQKPQLYMCCTLW